MPRPFTRAQALENAAFLAALRRTGNAREAARQLGTHRAKFTKRRAAHPAFAAEWDAALAVAHASLNRRACLGEADHSRFPANGGGVSPVKRREGAPHLHRTPSGRLQLRRAGNRRRLTRDAEQAFLAALSATANVRLSAAAAGFSHSAFYARAKASAAFAREMRLALDMGYERIELALLESFDPMSHADDAWRHNDPPPIPSMSPSQALQLLYLHQKEARVWYEPAYLKRRRGEPKEVHSFRLAAMYKAGRERDREAYRVAEAARQAAGIRSPFEPDAPLLPALDQVTGWSKADPDKVPHHPDVALFGGWRLKDWEGE